MNKSFTSSFPNTSSSWLIPAAAQAAAVEEVLAEAGPTVMEAAVVAAVEAVVATTGRRGVTGEAVGGTAKQAAVAAAGAEGTGERIAACKVKCVASVHWSVCGYTIFVATRLGGCQRQAAPGVDVQNRSPPVGVASRGRAAACVSCHTKR